MTLDESDFTDVLEAVDVAESNVAHAIQEAIKPFEISNVAKAGGNNEAVLNTLDTRDGTAKCVLILGGCRPVDHIL